MVCSFIRLSIRFSALAIAAAVGLAAPLAAQQAISASAGMLNHAEGQVRIGGRPLSPRPGDYPAIPEGQDLVTGEGRAEILLNPGAFLRVAEKSGIRMLSRSLTEPRIEILSGSVVLEDGGATDDSHIALVIGNTEVAVSRRGIYFVDCGRGLLRVISGQAVVRRGGETFTVDTKAQLRMDAGSLAAEELQLPPDEPFVRWAVERSGVVALDNCLSAARIHYRKHGRTHTGFWYQDPVRGTAYLPSRNYCRGFLGPLAAAFDGGGQ